PPSCPSPRSPAWLLPAVAPIVSSRSRSRRRTAHRAHANARCPAEPLSSRVPPFDTGEQAGQLLETDQIMSGHETINVRQGRSHPFRERLVVGIPLEWVDPDDRVGRALQALHLARDECWILALPAVGDEHDPGAAPPRQP